MTVTQVVSGTIVAGMHLHAPSGLNKGTTETLAILSGSGNTWKVSVSQTVSTPLTITGYYWKTNSYPNEFLIKFDTELCYKIFVDEIKEMRHGLRTSVDSYKYTIPYITNNLGYLAGGYSITSGYWQETVYHTILTGPRILFGFEAAYTETQNILDEWRIISDNRTVIPCSNSTGDITQLVDRIRFPDVFTKYLISGGKLEGTDIYIWRITIPPERFYSTGKVKLTRVGTDSDIPESIIIDSNSTDLGKKRGVWIKRNIPTPPEYTVSAG